MNHDKCGMATRHNQFSFVLPNPTMKKNFAPLGNLLVALSFMIFGVDHFVFQTFVTGRPQPWPTALPGQQLISYVSGVLFFTCGIAILIRKGWQFLSAAGVLILVWCGLPDLYLLIIRLDYGALLTQTNKALSIGGCALAMAWQLNKKSKNVLLMNAMVIERYLLGIFLFTAGIQHFIFAEFVQHLVPAWIPGHLFWTYFAGVALVAGGLGLITGAKAQLAATLSGFMVFIWVFTLHIPRAFSINDANEWTAVGEAILVSGMLLVIAADLREK
jgi:uncharacterized membrane protein